MSSPSGLSDTKIIETFNNAVRLETVEEAALRMANVISPSPASTTPFRNCGASIDFSKF